MLESRTVHEQRSRRVVSARCLAVASFDFSRGFDWLRLARLLRLRRQSS